MSLFSKLFKRNKVNTEALGLINLNSFIVYPNKSFYEEEENKRIYREFADSYKEVLNTHKTITSKDLNLNEEINVKLYTEIINKLLFELDYTLDLINNSPERNNVNIKILYLKLRHYQSEINNYKNEVFIKLKVLNELHKKYIFSKNKREAIKSEITNLEMNIVMCQNNFNALNMEINSYSNTINYTNLKEVDEEEYLSKRSKKLERYMNAYGLNYKSDTSISGLIANELILERYLFTNNFDLESEFEKVKDVNLSKEVKIQKLNIIIDKYMALKEITSKENKDLIKIIYDYKYLSIKENYINDPVNISNITFYKEELEYYENLIQNEIQMFAKDKDKKILEKYTNYFKGFRINEYERLVKMVRELVNNNEPLENDIVLGLIFSITSPMQLSNYFKQFKVCKKECEDKGVQFYEEVYSWEEYLPVETIIKLCRKRYDFYSEQYYKDINNVTVSKFEFDKENISDNAFKCLFSIYQMLFISKDGYDNNYCYEGLIEIKKRSGSGIYDKEINNVRIYEVYLPKSLKKLNTYNFCEFTDNSSEYYENVLSSGISVLFHLNEGLQELTLDGAKLLAFSNIPPSVKTITLNTEMSSLKFINYFNENNFNKDSFYELIKGIFKKDGNEIDILLNEMFFMSANNHIIIDVDNFINIKTRNIREITDKIFDYISNKFNERLVLLEKYAKAFELNYDYKSDFIIDKLDYLDKLLNEIKVSDAKELINVIDNIIVNSDNVKKFVLECDRIITKIDYFQNYKKVLLDNSVDVIRNISEMKYKVIRDNYEVFDSVISTNEWIRLERVTILDLIKSDINLMKSRKHLTMGYKIDFTSFFEKLIRYIGQVNSYRKNIEILNNKLILSTVFSLYDLYYLSMYDVDYSEKSKCVLENILQMFRDTKIPSVYASMQSGPEFEWKNFVPLDTLMRLKSRKLHNPNVKTSDKIDLMEVYYELYRAINWLQNRSDTFYLYEGLKSVNYVKESATRVNDLIGSLDITGMNVVLPESLEFYNVNISNCLEPYSITINKKLICMNLEKYRMNRLFVPNNVYDLKVNFNINEIIFKNFKNSKLLLTDARLWEFVNSLYDNISESDLSKLKSDNYKKNNQITLEYNNGQCIYIPLLNAEKIFSTIPADIYTITKLDSEWNNYTLDELKISVFKRIKYALENEIKLWDKITLRESTILKKAKVL